MVYFPFSSHQFDNNGCGVCCLAYYVNFVLVKVSFVWVNRIGEHQRTTREFNQISNGISMKNYNLQCNWLMEQWVDGTIVLPSDDPTFDMPYNTKSEIHCLPYLFLIY